jgi:hypothetical protein
VRNFNDPHSDLGDLSPYKFELRAEEMLERIERAKLQHFEMLEAAIQQTRELFGGIMARRDALDFPSVVELMHEIGDFENKHPKKDVA